MDQHQQTIGALFSSFTIGKRSCVKARFLQDRFNNSHALINRSAGVERTEAQALRLDVGTELCSQNEEQDLVESLETEMESTAQKLVNKLP